jgi:hypothetical protein
LAGLRQKGEVRQVLFCKWTTTIAFAASRRDSRGQHATAPACENSASMRKQRQQAGRRFSSRPVEAGQQSARRRCPDAVIAQATYTLLSLSISTRIVSLPLYLYTQPQTFHHPSQSHPISPPPIPAYVYVSPPPPPSHSSPLALPTQHSYLSGTSAPYHHPPPTLPPPPPHPPSVLPFHHVPPPPSPTPAACSTSSYSHSLYPAAAASSSSFSFSYRGGQSLEARGLTTHVGAGK